MAGHGRESIHGSSHACGMKLTVIYDHDYHIHHYKFKEFSRHCCFFKLKQDKQMKFYVLPGSWRAPGLLNPVEGGSSMSRYLETMRTETK